MLLRIHTLAPGGTYHVDTRRTLGTILRTADNSTEMNAERNQIVTGTRWRVSAEGGLDLTLLLALGLTYTTLEISAHERERRRVV